MEDAPRSGRAVDTHFDTQNPAEQASERMRVRPNRDTRLSRAWPKFRCSWRLSMWPASGPVPVIGKVVPDCVYLGTGRCRYRAVCQAMLHWIAGGLMVPLAG